MGVNRASHVKRASYPSGPRLDEYPSCSSRYDPPPAKLPNPDPHNYKINKAEEIGGYLILEIHYPDCVNFEGKKVLLFKATLLEVVNQKVIDPHFFNDPKIISPIARFVPTKEGWEMAKLLVKNLTRQLDSN